MACFIFMLLVFICFSLSVWFSTCLKDCDFGNSSPTCLKRFKASDVFCWYFVRRWVLFSSPHQRHVSDSDSPSLFMYLLSVRCLIDKQIVSLMLLREEFTTYLVVLLFGINSLECLHVFVSCQVFLCPSDYDSLILASFTITGGIWL